MFRFRRTPPLTIRRRYFEALLVLCVSMLAASVSSAVLGSFVCSLVVLCRRFNINPGASLILRVEAIPTDRIRLQIILPPR